MHINSTSNLARRYNTVNLRIEGNTSTLYEGPIVSGPRNITMGGVTIQCNGTSGTAGPINQGLTPGNTPTDALDAAARARGFTYNGTYAFVWNDFDISTIAGTANYGDGTIYTYWGSLVNYQQSSFGFGLWLSGCQQLVNPGDDVLWAYMEVGPSFNTDVNPERSFLKLEPTEVTVKRGQGFTVTVTDGRTGNLTQNAIVAGFKTNAQGEATIHLSKPGFFQYKAERVPDVRSNVMNVWVTD